MFGKFLDRHPNFLLGVGVTLIAIGQMLLWVSLFLVIRG